MKSRLELHKQLESIAPNVYFQPPDNVKIKYPAIVYEIDGAQAKYADDNLYRLALVYHATYITTRASDLENRIKDFMGLRYCKLVNTAVNDGLYNIYFDITN